MDPFVDLIRLLRPKATRWGRIDGFGSWGVSFRKRDDLLFFFVECGECQLTRPHAAPLLLNTGDFVLIRTWTPFTVTSDPSVEPLDSEMEVAKAGSLGIKLGEGQDLPVTVHGGRFDFDTVNQDLLTSMLPSLVHVAASDTSLWKVRYLLKINKAESVQPGPGSDFVVAQLMQVILVEILRSETLRVDKEQKGLLAGLADPVTSRALSAMHKYPARAWTVAELARLSMVSRSTFATRFRTIVGTGPIEYLQQWRMAIAKDALMLGRRSIGDIALAVGFQASSSFSAAFTRAAGCSPKRFATSARALRAGDD